MTRSWRRKLAAGISFLLLLTTNIAFALEAGDRAPAFAAPALDGNGTVELSKYRGKVVYLDFWASWCAPCLVAIPEIEEMRSEFPSEEFQILAVNLDQKKKKAQQEKKSWHIKVLLESRFVAAHRC